MSEKLELGRDLHHLSGYEAWLEDGARQELMMITRS